MTKIDYKEESTKTQGFILKWLAKFFDLLGFHVIVHNGNAKNVRTQYFIVSCKKLYNPDSPTTIHPS